jgi:hypothetical protein
LVGGTPDKSISNKLEPPTYRKLGEQVRDEKVIWDVAHVTEEDFETTEGETEDLYDKLMEMAGWKVTDKEKENDLT